MILSKYIKFFLFSFVFSVSFPLLSTPMTLGAFQALPNEFWPNTSSTLGSRGTEIQLRTAANNPDVFCKSQGNNYRLPSISEFNSAGRTVNPGGPSGGSTPAHWSTYYDNDITKTRKPDNGSRNVTGSLYNEWGGVKFYPAWANGSYWATEISYHTYGNNSGISRYYFNADGGIAPTPTCSYCSPTYWLSQRYVACVRDLVPTPSNIG